MGSNAAVFDADLVEEQATDRWEVGAPAETLWYFNNADGTFKRTLLRRQLDGGGAAGSGPRDPVFSVAVDPDEATGNTVYAGTVTGVWKGTRTSNATGAHTWVPLCESH